MLNRAPWFHLYGPLSIVWALAGCSWGVGAADVAVVVARVNGEPVLERDVAAYVRWHVAHGEGPGAAAAGALRAYALEALIDERLLLQAAEQSRGRLALEEVEAQVLQHKAVWPEGAWQQEMQRTSWTTRQWTLRWRKHRLIQAYMAQEVHSRIALREADIAAYIAEHRAVWRRPEQLLVAQIVLPTAAQAAEVLELLRGGKRFESLALEYSVTPEAQRGGYLGWISRGELPKKLEDACFALRLKHWSKVVDSGYGYHILRVSQRRRALDVSAAEAHQRASNLLQLEQERVAEKLHVEQLRAAASIEVLQWEQS